MRVFVKAPATLSNVGPGFDVLGLALSEPKDGAWAERTDEPGVTIVRGGPYGDRVPEDPAKNVAAFAARRVIEASGLQVGLRIGIDKQIPPGSGLGSSAASSVAAAVAAARALGVPLDASILLPIVRDAEGLAAGSAHLDNVSPALLGGFVAVVAHDPPQVRRLQIPKSWSFAVVLPDHPVETKKAREILPKEIPLKDAISNLRDIVAVIDAAARGDLIAFAAHLNDRLASPYRAPLWPFYEPARRAAIEAGAPAWVVSGSGPAMFGPCPTDDLARKVVDRVIERLAGAGFGAKGYVSSVSDRGAMEDE
jgi:homoserine kinase